MVAIFLPLEKSNIEPPFSIQQCPKGRASFVRRKRAAQKKGGDAKKGKQRSKGKKPTYTKTGA